MRKSVKVISRGDVRTGSMFALFPTWGWSDDEGTYRVWRWLERVSYKQTYSGTWWERYTWTDL